MILLPWLLQPMSLESTNLLSRSPRLWQLKDLAGSITLQSSCATCVCMLKVGCDRLRISPVKLLLKLDSELPVKLSLILRYRVDRGRAAYDRSLERHRRLKFLERNGLGAQYSVDDAGEATSTLESLGDSCYIPF